MRWRRCALTGASSLRLAFRLPASGKCSSICRTETKPAGLRSDLLELALDLARRIDLQDVALLDVLEVLEHDAALLSGGDLADVVLEAPQRGDLAVVDDGAVAHQACLGAGGDAALGDLEPAILPTPGGPGGGG